MPSIPELSTLTSLVLWASFAMSALFAIIAQRTHFCTMGAVSDIINLGDWTRMRQWAFAAGWAMLGFGLMAWAGWIDPARTVYASPQWLWLSALTGGVLFGFGMVLASGCGSKTLLRLGGGNLKALVVFLAMGLAAFATIKGVFAVVRVSTVERVYVEFAGGTSLADFAAAAFGVDARRAGLWLAVLLGGALMAWALRGRDFRTPVNLLGGLGIGSTVVAMWWITGHLGHVLEHPVTLEDTYVATGSGRIEALTFTAPMAYTLEYLLYFSDRNRVLTVAVVSVAGMVVGSALYAVLTRSFRWEGFRSTEDLVNHLVGGTLMGIGGVTAMGCSIGQGLSGISTLSASSFVAVAGVLMGAVAAFRYQIWRLERSA